jgi:hypothetical protein
MVPKINQNEAYEKILSTTLSRVIDFVKFAEAKNAALLTFSSAWLLGIINVTINNTTVHNSSWQWLGPIAIFCFTLSSCVAIFSFLPKKLTDFHRDPEREKSLIYFGDVSSFDPAIYRERVKSRYMPDNDGLYPESYLEDLAIQISVNSSVAERKFRFFNSGAIIASLGVLFIFIGAISPVALLALRSLFFSR